MTTKRWRQVAITVALALAGTGAGSSEGRTAQRPGPPPPDVREAPPGIAERGLALEREAYTYPAHERRNPFLPLDGPSHGGPEGDEFRLLGVIHHPDPAYRIAVLSRPGVSVDAENGGGPGARTAVRLRIGEGFGDLRIAAIEIDHVVVEMEEPGGTLSRVLAMPRATKGSGT